jgi:hypothetical protein
LEAVWIALIAVVTLTVGAAPAPVNVRVQVTLAVMALVLDGAVARSGIEAASPGGVGLDPKSRVTLPVWVAVVAGPAASVHVISTCWPGTVLETCTYGVANAKYEEAPGSDLVRIVAAVVLLVTDIGEVVLAPNSSGGALAHWTAPVPEIEVIAPALPGHVPDTRAWTVVGLILWIPTEPSMIFRKPTALTASLKFPTEPFASFEFVTDPFCSWLVPTLLAGNWVAAQPTPPSDMNRATTETTIGADGRRRNSDFGCMREPPVV